MTVEGIRAQATARIHGRLSPVSRCPRRERTTAPAGSARSGLSTQLLQLLTLCLQAFARGNAQHLPDRIGYQRGVELIQCQRAIRLRREAASENRRLPDVVQVAIQ